MLQKAFSLAILAVLGYLATTTQAQTREPQIAVIDMAGISGTFTFSPMADTQAQIGGANVVINIERGLTKELAISPGVGFEYHIHEKPVGPGDNCDATGGHLDPKTIGPAPCDRDLPDFPERCQEGDLSGKHGNLRVSQTGDFQQRYNDNQLKFTGDLTTIVGRSIVIHNNGTRIACANILPASKQQSANGLPSSSQGQGSNQQDGAQGQGGSSFGYNSNRPRSNKGHPSEGRFVSSEAMWAAVGSAACGIMAALMAL
ncbi:hypothetical protein BGX29_004035 [Mortierella sp. GBA35]|nr:hypothetical protein BGX29_004035 [Mortierella sp. GBA35]